MARNVLILALFLGLSACNTVAGVGTDISNGAHRVGRWLGG